MTTQEIANQLVALCRAGRNLEAVDTLLREDVQSVEVMGDETMPALMTGREAIRGKNEWWIKNHKVHSAKVKGPYPHGDRFAVIFDFEVTPAVGPMAGKRMRMEEVALYTVADGKITREEFFYDMSGASMDGEPAKPARKPAPGKKAKVKASRAASKAKKKTTAPKAKVKGRAAMPKAKAKAKARKR
jgi:ketosteroid isomerase-like protein